MRAASMDGIARRAATGKSALYRRWPNVHALALDLFITTLDESLPSPEPNTGSLRGDLLASLTVLRTQLDGDLGVILRELISEAAHDTTLAQEFQLRFGLRKQTELVGLLQHAMSRGEIPPHSIDPYLLQVPAALITHSLILHGQCPSQAELEHIIDAIVLPLLLNSPALTVSES